MDLLFTGAAAAMGTGMIQNMISPPMGNIPTVAQGSFANLPGMPSAVIPTLGSTGIPTPAGMPVITADNQWFAGQVGQVLNSITGVNIGGTNPTFIGIPEPFPYSPPSPGYTPNPFPGYTPNPLPLSNFGYGYQPQPNPYYSAFMNGSFSSFYGGLGMAFMFA